MKDGDVDEKKKAIGTDGSMTLKTRA